MDVSSLAGKRIFLTGGTGFFGYWLLTALDYLNAHGPAIEVVALSRAPDAFLARHRHFAAAKWLQLVRGDVRDYDRNLGAFDLVIHGAAATSPDAAGSPLTLLETVVAGSLRVAEHARLAGARRVLFISSGAVYGASQKPHKPCSETDACFCNPSDVTQAYTAGKLGLEAVAAAVATQFSIESVIARPFAFIGAELPPHLAVSQLLNMAHYADRIVLNGDGTAVRTYLYAADLALWLLVLLVDGASGETYNVGSNEAIRLLDAARIIRDMVAPQKSIEVLGLADSNPRRYYVPDIRKAQTELGLSVWTDFETSVRHTAGAFAAGAASA